MPEVGDVYETNLSHGLVLWCLNVRTDAYSSVTVYDFLIIAGDDPHGGSLWRSWSQGGLQYMAGCDAFTFDMRKAMESFAFKRIA